MKRIKKLIWLYALASITFLPVYGQTNFSTQLVFTDGGGDSIFLTLGVNTAATYAIDPAFNEGELPPSPPAGVLDARFLDLPGRSTTTPEGHGQGLSVDIRNLANDLQTDTFNIYLQPGTGSEMNIRWASNLASLGGGRWRLFSSFSVAPTIDIDMTKQTSAIINTEDYSSLYIVKGDSTSYRTFNLATLALDVDAKGKKGKPIPQKSNQVEFCMTVPNDELVPINSVFVQFKTPVDTSRLSVQPFTSFTVDPKQKPNAQTKFTFSGATINPGELITICGYGVKDGTKLQAVASWYLLNSGIIQGKKKTQKTGIVFTQNDVRLPMPNTFNIGDQMMKQALPNRTDLLIVGSTLPIPGVKKDTFRYVEHKKYSDVLKSLIKDYGKKGYIMQDTLADCMTHFDDARNGYRYYKKIIKTKVKTLSPDKHRNRLFGEALVLKVNILFSQTQTTPAGLGELVINDPTSPFYGVSLDTLAKRADEYLTFCTVASAPTVTADDLADLIAEINGSFEGPMDTTVWTGVKNAKIVTPGVRAIADIGLVKRVSGVEPKIIPDLSGVYDNSPVVYQLQQNYPNPFNPTTTIDFTLPDAGLVTIEVYNVLGQKMAVLADNELYSEGIKEVTFSAHTMPSGIYYYRFVVNDLNNGATIFQQTRKMILLK